MSSLSSSSFELGRYGWDEQWASVFAPYQDAGLVAGRIVRVDRGQCEVVTAGGPVRAGCGGGVCTGDWAALDGRSVSAVLPRRSALMRAVASGRSDAQVLAANVDVVAVVVSCALDPDLGRLERLLALAWESGARPVVVLTKADASAEPEGAAAAVATAAVGVDTVLTSATSGRGLAALAAALTGTVVLVGQSGVGKSTLVNVLTGTDAPLAVTAVRDSDGKGRHTTVRRELVPLASGTGVLIDTPGLRGVGLWDAADGLSKTFADIDALAAGCRFGDCAHGGEPGCAVRAAIDAGVLPARRLASYRTLIRENEWAAARTDARLRAERRAKDKVMHKAIRRNYQRRGH